MTEMIRVGDVYNKNLNFLIGSGASSGLFPTLALGIKDEAGAAQTIETLATLFNQNNDRIRYASLFMHYYHTCIRPVIEFELESVDGDQVKAKVVENYQQFMKTVLALLLKRKELDRRTNIFTTNYDGCLELVADRIHQTGTIDFVLNDGARGFNRRFLQARNFNSFVCQTGVFERSQIGIPQLNLIHVHGSAYWKKDKSSIRVDYSTHPTDPLLTEETIAKLGPFSQSLLDANSSIADLPVIDLTDDEVESFWAKYDKLPIVNPTKWKFHETVFEEHYYQMLRLLSYELEKPNAILITFGFSFADEHILKLVQRSLSNPSLQVFICCYSKESCASMREEFNAFPNVECISVEGGKLDFTAFNQTVFSLNPQAQDLEAAGNIAAEAK
jgi:hypothetical protein